ncbi:MAG: 4Fe-4S dicluster domain-containing protein [Deltaproteobacteria bacterium]|nr:4Fe-4S dicluster domain-containing protein [Deltaproteobacteria bacterium]MBF0524003.1 4Fe-4S dicluster domain-containing protein [Deltaproteobacteria bacterium]
MLEYVDKIRDIARRLLSENKVDVVIGFRQGSVPMMSEPAVISRPEDVDELYWDYNCGINLTNYLTKRPDRIGIVAKGCDSRNIVTHMVENQIKREQLYIIGAPCHGMIDRSRILAALGDQEPTKVVVNDSEIVVTGPGLERKFDRKEYLQNNCATCIHRNPVIYDELLAAPVEEQKLTNRYADVEKIEAMSPDDKWAFFDKMLAPCIRCYACRNACPLCYCPTCFVDEARPQWVGKSIDPTDVRTFHFLRAYHCAGRCTDCGACERACPVNIPVRLLTKKLNKDVEDLYGFEPGMVPDVRPPLDVYRPDDPGGFIK